MKDNCIESDDHLIQHFRIIYTIEFLGIDLYFQPQIKVAMDYVFNIFHELDLTFIRFSDCVHY